MNAKYHVVFSQHALDAGHFRGLTESQLIKTLFEQGFHRVSSITYEGQSPGQTRPLEGKELIAIWKHVYRTIQERKHEGLRKSA